VRNAWLLSGITYAKSENIKIEQAIAVAMMATRSFLVSRSPAAPPKTAKVIAHGMLKGRTVGMV